MREATVHVIHWRYRDGSDSKLVAAYLDEALAESAMKFFEEHGDPAFNRQYLHARLAVDLDQLGPRHPHPHYFANRAVGSHPDRCNICCRPRTDPIHLRPTVADYERDRALFDESFPHLSRPRRYEVTIEIDDGGPGADRVVRRDPSQEKHQVEAYSAADAVEQVRVGYCSRRLRAAGAGGAYVFPRVVEVAPVVR